MAFYYNIPSVRIEIESRSLSLPLADTGRSVFSVIVGPKGPHNRVVEINSFPQFQRIFGKPNLSRTSQTYYQMYSALRYTSRIYVIRAVLLDSDVESENAGISNIGIKYNSPTGSEEQLFGKFIFTNATDATTAFTDATISKYVITDFTGYEQFQVGDYIFSYSDDDTSAKKIIARSPLDAVNNIYYLELESNYTGTTSVDQDNANALLVSFVDTLLDGDLTNIENYSANLANSYAETSAMEHFKGVLPISGGTYTFTNGSNIVIASDITAFDAVKEEDWLYPSGQSSDLARQVINKQVNENSLEYELILDENFDGVTSASPESAKSYVPFELVSSINVKSKNDLDMIDDDNTFYFMGIGAGEFYNSLYLKGVRNVEYEKMYMTNDPVDPEPIYKYAFMDLYLYQRNDDGTSTELERYGTVSLMNRIESGTTTHSTEIVLDPSTGREIFLPTVINETSQFIQCYGTENGIDILEGSSAEAEKKRLQFMSLFVEGVIGDSTVRGKEGFFLENGEDGIQYNAQGRINMNNGMIKGVVTRAYNGTLTSADEGGSIQKLIQEQYPKYTFDYIVSGGYAPEIQKAASDLAWSRGSMLELGDTGGYKKTPDEDIAARRVDCNWNNWSAALYTQYRQINSDFEGKKIWISPVYHAIERHLRTDRDSWIAEPVAGIVNGVIEEPHKLAYEPTLLEVEKLTNERLNPTLVDESTGGGTYFIAQQTTYKPLSVLSHLHVVKFMHFVKTSVPPLLRDILFRKATPYWQNQVSKRITKFLTPYTVSEGKYAAITSFDISTLYDRDRNTIYADMTIKPIGYIQNIVISINVI